MPQNVEIKAMVRDPENAAAIIYDLTESLGTIFRQEDTFFPTATGRLKLRVLDNSLSSISEISKSKHFRGTAPPNHADLQGGRIIEVVQHDKTQGELLYYERPNAAGPKCSEYYSSFVPDAKALKVQLEKALGVLGTVRKARRLYMFGTTRIHLDDVIGLGSFVELEVGLQPGQTVEDGQKIARELMAQLGIEENDLVSVAYLDLLLSPGHDNTPTEESSEVSIGDSR